MGKYTKMQDKTKLIVVLGPTSSGKSDLAVEVARKFNGEVVSADSRQVYRGLDVGTGKITTREMKGIPHHLLDVADPKRQFSVVQYKRLATRAIADITKRGKVPIICGGTGFYIDAITKGATIPEVPPNKTLRKELATKSADELFVMLKKLDVRRASNIDAKNPVRLIRAIEIATALGAVPSLEVRSSRYEVLQIGIKIDRDALREKIVVRLERRMRRGMVAEGRRLRKEGLSWVRMRALGLEYRALADLLTGVTTREEMIRQLTTKICQYAKRQMVWFKRDKGTKWFTPTEQRKVFMAVRKFLKTK